MKCNACEGYKTKEDFSGMFHICTKCYLRTELKEREKLQKKGLWY